MFLGDTVFQTRKICTGIIFLLVIVLCLSQCSTNTSKKPISFDKVEEPPVESEKLLYGISLTGFDLDSGTVENGWTLSHMLVPFGISQHKVNVAYQLAKDSINLFYISKDRPFKVLISQDSAKTVTFCIYDRNPFEVAIFDFTDSVEVRSVKKEIELVKSSFGAFIYTGQSMASVVGELGKPAEVSFELIDKIESIYAWTVDFFRLMPEDYFKVIYQEEVVEGRSVGVRNIESILFMHEGRALYAFEYEQDSVVGYYDELGKGMRRTFLKAPLQYSRISSGYSRRRFHPVQKRWKAHLGTDYAAPKGTPIWSTADGVISASRYGKYNGYFVKVKHNKVFTTQYLHMTKIAKGIKPGVAVKQGEVIGYVGSTGLATGPHVCYRFWKNGKQIDPRKQIFPPSDPIRDENLGAYNSYIKPIRGKLDKITFFNVPDS